MGRDRLVGIDPSGHIKVMIPQWIYTRLCDMLVVTQSGAKPEDYIVAILEGHLSGLNT